MPTFSEIYPIIFLLMAFLTTGWLVLRRYPIATNDKPRDIQVDGLRALLAFGVLSAHFFGIRNVIQISEVQWDPSSSILTRFLGGWSVQIFFAITAYLFSSRLVNNSPVGIDWLRFFVCRFFRLVPICLLCAFIIFVMMNVLFFDNTSGIETKENWFNLINLGTSSIQKGAGVIGKHGDPVWVYAVPMGAHWSLHYEWLFYALLPIIGVVSRSSRRVLWFLVSIMLTTVVMKDGKGFFTGWSTIMLTFIPGLLLGLTSKYWKSNKFLNYRLTAALAITAVLASACYPTHKVRIPANTLFLAVVLSNNTATRFLESKLLRSLGETTYSIYLLHGLVQYATLKWVVTIPMARIMPQWLWWMTCAVQVVVIVIFARLSFEYVEKPGIEAGKRFYAWLMNLIERRAKWLLNWI